MRAQVRTAVKRDNIASIFLKEFTKQLIINSMPKPKVDPELIERVKRRLEGNKSISDILKPSIRIEIPQIRPVLQKPMIRNNIPVRSNMQGNLIPSRMAARGNSNAMAFPVQKSGGQVHVLKSLSPTELELGRLATILADPAVTGVECPGADKSILVNRSGLVQAIPQTMNKEEMENILKEFSTKTKIPLLPGVFKALHNNLLITAVISEIAGNRFIIEKHFGQPSLPRKEPEPNVKKA